MKEARPSCLLQVASFPPSHPPLVSVAPGPPVWFVPHLLEWDFALDALTAVSRRGSGSGGVDDDLAPNESLFLGGGQRGGRRTSSGVEGNFK